MEVKDDQWGSSSLPSSDPKDRNMLFSPCIFKNKITRECMYCLGKGHTPLVESVTGVRAWSPLAILGCAYPGLEM